MKMTRKLIPAFVMLIVSAIMLSTASFAWLAESTSVSAGPMTVKANTDVVFMQISNNQNDWGRSATATTTESGNLNLVTPKSGSENGLTITDGKVTWQTGNGKDPDKPDVDGALTDVPAGDVNNYVLANTFYIKMSNAESKLYNLKLSGVALAEGDKIAAETFDESLRVLAVAKDAGSKILGVQCWDLGAKGELKKDGTKVFGDKLADKVTVDAITVDVYVYYDGNDEYAFTDKLITSVKAGRQITVSFSADKSAS